MLLEASFARYLRSGHCAGGGRLLAQACERERRGTRRLGMPEVAAAEKCRHGASINQVLPAPRRAAKLPDTERSLEKWVANGWMVG